MTRKTLLKARNTRLGPFTRATISHTPEPPSGWSQPMPRLLASPGMRNSAKRPSDLLDKSRTTFSDGPILRLFSKQAPNSIGEGRAFLYGLALQAALDVSTITSDEKWLDWSENLATTAAELFTDAEFLKECPDDAKIIDLPVTDLVMLFDDSTAGLISFAECRLAERERPLVATFSTLATPLPTYSVDRPILHTDLLQATLARQFKVTLVTGAALSAGVEARRRATAAADVPTPRRQDRTTRFRRDRSRSSPPAPSHAWFPRPKS